MGYALYIEEKMMFCILYDDVLHFVLKCLESRKYRRQFF
jgi:hypothetical protein